MPYSLLPTATTIPSSLNPTIWSLPASIATMLNSFLTTMSSGNTSEIAYVIAIATPIATLASMFIWPVFTKRYQKQEKERYEKERQQKYGEYVEKKRIEIDVIMRKQKQILIENYIPLEECEKIILTKNRNEFADYLTNLAKELGINNEVKLECVYCGKYFDISGFWYDGFDGVI